MDKKWFFLLLCFKRILSRKFQLHRRRRNLLFFVLKILRSKSLKQNQMLLYMVAEMLQKSKFLLYVLHSCYMKFYFCYLFHNHYVFMIYLHVYYMFLNFVKYFLFSHYLILSLCTNVFVFIICTKLL